MCKFVAWRLQYAPSKLVILSFITFHLFGRYDLKMTVLDISGCIPGLVTWNRSEREYSKSFQRLAEGCGA